MEDYKELIKQMLLRDFSAVQGRELVRFSTEAILKMVCGVIPKTPIDEHLIFEAMQEAGFMYSLSEEEEEYRWNLYRK